MPIQERLAGRYWFDELCLDSLCLRSLTPATAEGVSARWGMQSGLDFLVAS